MQQLCLLHNIEEGTPKSAPMLMEEPPEVLLNHMLHIVGLSLDLDWPLAAVTHFPSVCFPCGINGSL